MTFTVPGKLQKQGPIATIDGGISMGYHDKFLFNGEQFVQFVATIPGVIQASANNALALSDDMTVSTQVSYGAYRDSNNTFRLVNGNPVYDDTYTGIPTDDYNHIIIGYDSPVSTNVIKLWTEQYIPVEVLRVDYGYDGDHWYNVPTHAGNITFEFDANMYLYSSDDSPTGQYEYTIDLGGMFTANYWRIRSFLGLHSMATVDPVEGNDVTLVTVSGLPSRSDLWDRGSLRLAYGTVTEYTSPGSLNHKFYKSEGTGAMTWDSVSTDHPYTGAYTISGCVMDESQLSVATGSNVEGPVTLPGWINNLSVWLREDYEVQTGVDKVLKPGTASTGGSVSCLALSPEYQFPNCNLYDFYYTNVPGCFFVERASGGSYVSFFWGDCFDYNPIMTEYTEMHGSFSSDGIFYLSSFTTPFDVTTETPFTSTYLPGDIGPNGGTLYTYNMVTSFSGTDPDPGGDPVTVAQAGARVDYATLGASAIEDCSSNVWDVDTVLLANTRFIYTYPMNATQVAIQPNDVPLFRYWESDGSIAVTNEIDDENIFDLVYDSADNVFYAAVMQETTGYGSTIDDEFETSTIDQIKWNYTGSAITLDTTNSGIVFRNTASGTAVNGMLTSNYYYSGSFTGELPVLVTTLSGYNYYGLSYVDYENWNTAAFVGITGDWGEIPTRAVSAVTVSEYIDISDGTFYVSNVTPDIRDVPDGEYSHEFKHIQGTWYYTRTPVGMSCDVCAESVGPGPQLSASGISLKINSSTTIQTYSSITFTTKKYTDTGITTSGIDLDTSFDSSTNTFVLGYNDGSDNVLSSGILNSLDNYSFSPRISGKTNNVADVFTDYYSSTGGHLRDASVLSIVALDVEGHRTEVTGVSDVNGVVIGSLEAIEEGFDFSSYRGKVSVASTQTSEGDGGSLFVRVENNVYKYNKTTLPLSSDDGSSTAMFSAGSVVDDDIRNFGYDGFVNGGLHYMLYDNDRDLVMLREMTSSTLWPTTYEVELDVESINTPLAMDPVDLDTLFVVEDDDVYVMNMDPDSVSFCNVVVSDPIIPANSGYQTTVTAFVTNLYGDPLQNRLVSFSITSGGGSVSPATACTTSSGTASITFTADDAVGTTVITATASNTTC